MREGEKERRRGREEREGGEGGRRGKEEREGGEGGRIGSEEKEGGEEGEEREEGEMEVHQENTNPKQKSLGASAGDEQVNYGKNK